MDRQARVFLAGHRGMVGSAIARRLSADGYAHVLSAERRELDLSDQAAVRAFFARTEPQYVVLAAARVGGIVANNTYPAEFIYDNLMIEANVIEAAHRVGVERLVFLGSSCIYPKHSAQPIREEALLTGALEPTNEPYAIAKIAGIKLCESYHRQHGRDFRSLMPTNLYGPGDNFHPTNSHVIPGLLRRFHEAAEAAAPHVSVWGSGRPRREFLYVDDLAAAVVFALELEPELYWQAVEPMCSHLNVGTGVDVTIAELAEQVRRTVGFDGDIVFDPSKPDGTPRKLLDIGKIRGLGWQPVHGLADGLQLAYRWFLDNQAQLRR